MSKSTTVGIETRHGRGCASRVGDRCSCKPAYQAHVWSAREKRRIRKTFPTLAAAKSWRQDAQVGLRRGTMRAPTPTTLRQAAAAWLKGAGDGSIRTRSGDLYKPSALRGYEAALRLRILPDFGGARLSEIGRVDVQDLADRLLAQGLDASTIRNTLMPLRAIFRRALSRGEVAVNPTTALELPAVRGKRDRVASPFEAVFLLDALPESDRALWATAMYAGLRRGELLALRWEDVALGPSGIIRVERSWDERAGAIEPKTAAGRRAVPIPVVLRDLLTAHRAATNRTSGLVFGVTEAQPFTPSNIRLRANRAWLRAGHDPIGLHECRHTFASLMIAARVNAKALSSYMGHSSVTITFDRYGHLMPGNEEEAADLLDAYLKNASGSGSAPSLAAI